MANRTVSVELTLKSEQYKAGIESSKIATEELDHKVEELDRDINKLPADAAKAAASIGVLGGTAKEVGNDVGDLGKKTEETGKKTDNAVESTKTLRMRMDELKDSLKTTGAEFEKNADPALFKKFRADSSELAGLTKMRKEIEALGNDLKGGGSGDIGELFAGGLTSPAGLAAGGMLAGPALAAAGGLALGGLGVAGAGVGVASAVMGNPKAFELAWQDATAHVQKDFFDIGAAFTGPTLAAIKTIGPAIDGWHLADALAPAAKYVPMIVAGVEGAATGIEHGLADVIAKAGPDVQALSDGLTQLGQAGGDALSSIAGGAEGGAQALHDVFTATSAAVEGFGKITEAAENAYSFIQDHPIEAGIATGGLTAGASILSNAFGNADDSGKHLGATLQGVALNGNLAADAAREAAPDFGALSTAMNATKVDGDSLAETMSTKVLSSMMGIDRAVISFDQALLTVDEAVKKNGHTLDEHTAKGLANRSMMLDLVQANIAEYRANVAAGMGAEAAAKAYDDGTAALERQLRKAGFTQDAIDGLISKYKGVPKNIDTDIAINGLKDAIDNLGDLIAQLNHIDGHNYHSTVTTDYIENTKSVYNSQVPKYTDNSSNAPHHDPHPHAAGGILDPGWNLVGEEGPELLYNSRVFTASQTRTMMAGSTSASSGSSGPMAVMLQMAPGANLTPLGTLLNQMLRDGLFVVKASQVRVG